MMASLSRQLAQWVVGLRYENLPPEVVDRAKGVTLHSLASVLLGSQSPGGQQAVQLITAEEVGVRHGATIMLHGTRVTKGGATFANSEMAMAGGKLDSFRMLTHPVTSIVPGAFVAAEAEAGVSPARTRGSQGGEALMMALARQSTDVAQGVRKRSLKDRILAGKKALVTGGSGGPGKVVRLPDSTGEIMLSLALMFHYYREGAPFNGRRDRFRRELRVDSGVRGTQHASRHGTPWGVKPADNGPASVSHTADDRTTPATYADERNLRKRRNSRQVKVAVTPGPKWEGGGPAGSFLPLALSLIRSALSRQLRVARTSLLLELGNSHAA